MVDYTPSDEIARIFREEAAPILASHFHPDDFEVERAVDAPDGYGGSTTEYTVVDAGRCRLDITTQGVERSTGAVIVAARGYTVELPLDVDLEPTDTLIVNGRRFDVVGGPFQGGEDAMFTTANVEERG